MVINLIIATILHGQPERECGNGATYRRLNYSTQIDYSNNLESTPWVAWVISAANNMQPEVCCPTIVKTGCSVQHTTMQDAICWNTMVHTTDRKNFPFIPICIFPVRRGVGWVVTEEPFFKKLNATWLDMLNLEHLLAKSVMIMLVGDGSIWIPGDMEEPIIRV